MCPGTIPVHRHATLPSVIGTCGKGSSSRAFLKEVGDDMLQNIARSTNMAYPFQAHLSFGHCLSCLSFDGLFNLFQYDTDPKTTMAAWPDDLRPLLSAAATRWAPCGAFRHGCDLPLRCIPATGAQRSWLRDRGKWCLG